MAMQVGGSGGIKADINVTPLVDVMLVLLIIMMIVAPLLQQGVNLTLPLALHSVDKPQTADQTVVAVDARGRFYVGTKEVQKDNLGDAVKAALESKKEKVVIIKGDGASQYGSVMEAMDQLRKAGIEDLGLITGTRAPKREGASSMAAHQHFGAEKVFKASIPQANSDMNITPMIDVLLVLLVIFMAALPISQKGLDVNLPPETQKKNQKQVRQDQIVFEYTNDGVMSINKTPVSAEDLPERLRTIFADRNEKTMFIVGDGGIPYKNIIFVIDSAKGAGVDKVGIVTEGMRREAQQGGE